MNFFFKKPNFMKFYFLFFFVWKKNSYRCSLKIFCSMDPQETQTWVIFYLISFVVLLLALFFTTQGMLLGIGMTLILLVIGINFYLIWSELKKAKEKQELMSRLSKRTKNE